MATKHLSMMLCFFVSLTASADLSFTYNGFRSTNLTLDGLAQITSNGLLAVTNHTRYQKGHAFYPNPISFKNPSNSPAFSFSTTFVFAIVPEIPTVSGHGIAFVIAPTRGLPGSFWGQFLGLFNESTNGNLTNHVFAVELDTILSRDFGDIDDNHVGIDINGLRSVNSTTAAYYANLDGKLMNLSLNSGKPMQIWMEYDGLKKQVNVTLAPVNVDKPSNPLMSLTYDLSPIMKDTMYVGFSSSTGSVSSYHYVLGWSYSMNGQAHPLDLSQLPKLPRIGPKKTSKLLTVGLPLISTSFILIAILGLVYYVRRIRKYTEVVEDWELEHGPHRFKYKDLYVATKGFKEKELLGKGGFGRVYRGVLQSSKLEIAVKKVNHESTHGMKVFVAEIVSLGRIRHRNIVPLLGYSRCQGELLLVYDYMPNGSLDKYLYGQLSVTLNWSQRFRVVKGVAAGLLYLHEEWEQVVIHRDVKASNVLLDSELNGRLGDFGLARLYDHGTDPQTTHIVGTLGYIAPEHTRSGKATTKTDVFAFGAFLLEVACGKRPIERREEVEDVILVDWVNSLWARGEILQARDLNMGSDYVAEEVELVLKLGLLCSNSEPKGRPSMRRVVQYLEGDLAVPELSTVVGPIFANKDGFDDFAMSYLSSVDKPSTHSSSIANSLLSGGR